MKALVSYLLIGLLVTLQGIAQPRGCAVNLPNLMQKGGAAYEGPGSKVFENWLETLKSVQYDDSTVYQIPVVVHIIHNGEAVGQGTNLPDSRVFRQIEILNEDFRKIPGTRGFNNHPAGADTKIQFVLSQRDPDGNVSSGIVRVQGTQTVWGIGDNNQLKNLSVWPENQYLNIWVCDINGNEIGYAQMPLACSVVPFNGANANVLPDGVVIDYEVFGDNLLPNTRFPSYNRGRTATHEIGHFLGLIHIWGDANDCSGTDFCEDTPPQMGNSTRCQRNRFSCGFTNMVENYLDYSNDTCMNIFTNDQARRMRTVLANCPRRATLLTSPAAVAGKMGRPASLWLYPNPAKELLTMQLPVQYLGKPLTVLITDTKGKMVYTANHTPMQGNSQLKINLIDLPQGLYNALLIASDNQLLRGTFIKH
jgi:hypothetical protein